MDHTDDDRRLRVQNFQRGGDKPQGLEQLVQKAVGSQNDHPAVGTDHGADQKGKQDHNHHNLLHTGLGPGHVKSRGIAQHQGDGGGHQGHPEGDPEDVAVKGISEEIHKIGKTVFMQGVDQNVDHRCHEEKQQGQYGGQCQQQCTVFTFHPNLSPLSRQSKAEAACAAHPPDPGPCISAPAKPPAA